MVRQVNERSMRRGVKLRYKNVGNWEVKQVLHANDTVLVAETREHLQHIVSLRGRVTVWG